MGGILVRNVFVKITTDPNSPSELSKPTWALRSAFWASVIFYVMTDSKKLILEAPLASIDAAKLIITCYLILHAWTTVVIDEPFVPFPIRIIESVFFFITRIPGAEDEKSSEPKYITKEELQKNCRRKEKKREKC